MNDTQVSIKESNYRPELYKSLFDGSPDAMLLIEDNLFVACNDATLKMLQLSAESDLFAMHPSKLSPEYQPCGLLSVDKAEQMMAIAYEQGNHRFEWIHTGKNKRPFRVEVLLTRLSVQNHNLIHVVWRDISTIYEKYHQLEISKIFYDSVTDAIMITDENARIIEVNSAFEHITGYSFKESVGQSAGFMKSGKHSADFYRKMWQAISISGQWKGTLYDRHKEGHIYKKFIKIQAVKNEHGVVENYIAVFSEASQQAHYEKRLRKLAYYDSLTDLPNRRLILKSLNQKVALASQQTFALFFIDIDNFKRINDTYGHYVGDEILKEVKARLLPLLSKGDLLGRMSGDEFILVANYHTNDSILAKKAEQILAVFTKPVAVANHQIDIALSVGISRFPAHGKTLKDILINADVAMYQAKSLQGCQYYIYEQALGDAYRKAGILTKEITKALNSRQFVPHFQPKMDLKTNNYCGAEVLARWFDETGNQVPTSEFIPCAENSGQIKAISELVMLKAANLIVDHQSINLQRVSVNISGAQLSSKRLYDELLSIIHQTNVPYQLIELEVTESQLIENFDTAKEALTQLRKLGIKVALDDFGTGYSSFSYLKQFPIDTIKIDKCFIDDIVCEADESNESFVIVKGIIQLAHALGLEVVAEGIETPDQMTTLAAIGCDKIQGYYYAKPMDFESFIGFVSQ